MKIACQSCQAKYTIADDKVLGRVVKIRCKKCGATIVINGNDTAGAGGVNEEATQAAPNSRAFDYAAQQSEEPWTVNVADGDQRTLATADVVAQFKAGVVNDETYCWKDGMGDWLPLREIESLASACGIGGQAPAPEPARAAPVPAQPAYAAPAAAASASGGGLGALFGGGDTAGNYGAPPPAEANGHGALHAAPAAARRIGGRAGAADLFGAAADAGGENDVMTSAPHGAPAMHEADSKLTGQRNENSVLFSLNALTQGVPKQETPGPQGDGSGLIDIRALSANMAPQSKRANHIDDIMNLGGGGAFSAALAAPVLAPPMADGADYGAAGTAGGKSNKMLMLGLFGMGALIAVLLVVVLLRPKADLATTATPSTSGATPAGSAPPVAANDTASAAPTAAEPSQGAAPGSGGAAPVDPTKNNAASTPTTGSPASSHHGTSAASGGPGAAAAAAAAAPASPTMPSAPAAPAHASFDDALKAAGGGGSAPPPPAANATAAPFDRGAAAGALGAVNVAGCKRPDGPTGSGHVAVTFSPDGTVSSAVVDQAPFAGTPVGGCVAGKFRGAHIPSFGGGPVRVGKSFTIN
jgi:predicted Zn finger-like uncharacterized protein